MALEHHSLFPTSVYTFEALNIDLTALADDIRQWAAENPTGQTRSNAGDSWHSPVDAYTRPAFAPLMKAVLDAGTEVLVHQHAPGGSNCRLIEMWANILRPGGWNRPHNHGATTWSGVVYIDCQANAPAIEFLPPYLQACASTCCNPAIPAHNGNMLIFPSWLMHYVPPVISGERISVSFNLQTIPPKPAPEPDWQPYVHIPRVLNDDDLTRAYAQLSGVQWQEGAVGGGKEGGGVRKEMRDNHVYFASGDAWAWLIEKITNAARIVNDTHYKVDLATMQPMQFARYGPGQEYKVHEDSGPGNKRTLSVAITLKNAIEGGGTSFPRADEQPQAEPGDAVFFRSDEKHAALPVIEGRRDTLICWFEGAETTS